MASENQTLHSLTIFIIAGVFAMLGLLLALYNIIGHVTNYNSPQFQRPIVRILFIIPIYACVSWTSLHVSEVTGIYLEIARDWYEAFVIYCFLAWILVAIGGESTCGHAISRRMYMSHPWPLCCLPHLRLNLQFLKACKALTLQFVILKPIMASVSFTLLAFGHGTPDLYLNPVWQHIRLVLYNTSYTIALYGLLLFYLATKEEMTAYSPIKKFIGVKTIVFATYWQQLVIPFVFGSEDSGLANDFILCIEMLFFAYLHFRAFPWWEFKGNSSVGSSPSSRPPFLEQLDARSKTISTGSSPLKFGDKNGGKEALLNIGGGDQRSSIQFTSIDDVEKEGKNQFVDTETTSLNYEMTRSNQGTRSPSTTDDDDDDGSRASLRVISTALQYGKNLVNVMNPTDVVQDTVQTFGIRPTESQSHAANLRYTALSGDEDEAPAKKRVESPRSMVGLRFDSHIRVQTLASDIDDPALD